MLAVASTPSTVHQVQRSLVSSFILGPCLCLPSSFRVLSTFSKLPFVWRDEERWGVRLLVQQPSCLHAWKTHLTCWPTTMSLVREGLSKVTAEVGYGSAGFSCKHAAGMGEETMAAGSDMPTPVGAERETNGMLFTANLRSFSKIGFLL